VKILTDCLSTGRIVVRHALIGRKVEQSGIIFMWQSGRQTLRSAEWGCGEHGR